MIVESNVCVHTNIAFAIHMEFVYLFVDEMACQEHF